MKLAVKCIPEMPNDECVRLRARLIAKEFFEHLEAMLESTFVSDANDGDLEYARCLVMHVISRGRLKPDIEGVLRKAGWFG